jgi:general secretion pathway protein G
MFDKSKSYFFGFTLIELLVVMSIIAILAGLSAFGIQNARESARNARRQADLETIRSALEIYKADCNQYPAVTGNAEAVLGSPFTGGACNLNVYIQETPTDPQGGSYYYASAIGLTYRLCAELENPGTIMTCTGRPASFNYQVVNP